MAKAKIVGSGSLVGKPVFIRTVTHYYTGKLVALNADELVLDDAAWISDTDRWSQALSTGQLSEVEPYPGRCFVSRGAVVDISEWKHALPREVK